MRYIFYQFNFILISIGRDKLKQKKYLSLNIDKQNTGIQILLAATILLKIKKINFFYIITKNSITSEILMLVQLKTIKVIERDLSGRL